MGVRLVILDLDGTAWDHRDVTGLRLPVRRIDAEAVEDAAGVRVRLRPGLRVLLRRLRQLGILVSLASLNDPTPVFAILDALHLRRFFVHPQVEWQPYHAPRKERLVSAVLRALAADGVAISPQEVLVVDDRLVNLRRLRAVLGPVQTLHAGVEIRDLREVLSYVTPAGPSASGAGPALDRARGPRAGRVVP